MPVTVRRTLAKVNSPTITARQPEVPNLICVSIRLLYRLGAESRELAGDFI